MFDRYESLMDRVTAVARRFRSMHFWRLMGSFAVAASLIGWWLLGGVRDGRWSGQQAAAGLSIATLVAGVAAFIFARRSYRNPRWIASKIESRFPSLQQRLLTALSLVPLAEKRELGFLQQRVISDAFHHSVTHRWGEAVPRAQSLLSRLGGGLSLLVLAFVVSMLWLSTPGSLRHGSSSRLSVAPEITVEPGDTEVERGSGLVISARFPSAGELPDELTLMAVDDDGALQEVPMSQSLDDPVLSAYVPTIEKRFRYRVASSNWQSNEYSVDVFDFPDVVRADAVLDFPDYTNLQTKRIEDTARIAAVEGTKVQWELLLNKPLTTIVIRDKEGHVLEVNPHEGQPNAMRFEVELTKTDRWTIELSDEKGRKNKYPITLDARAIANRPPELKLTHGGDLVASPLEELSLAATAQDDFGIVRAGIAYSFAGGQTEDLVLADAVPAGATQTLNHLIELETLGAEPDQLLTYHFWAEDHAPAGEVRRTQSDLFFGEVRPFEEIFREGESPAGGQQPPQPSGGSQQTEELVELQKQIIAATWKLARTPDNAKSSKTFAADIDVLQQSQQQAIDQASELAEAAEDAKSKQLIEQIIGHMQTALEQLQQASDSTTRQPLDPALAAEQAAYQSLLQLRAREFQVSRSRQQRGQSSGSASAQRRQQQLDELELKNDENRYETQSQATDANQEDDAQREDRQILSRLKELAQRQEDINNQLTQLQSALEQAKTEAEKEEVRRQLKRLREQEQELLREADELADRMQQQQDNQSQRQLNEQLEQTRENIRKSSEALDQNNAPEALAAGTRAERELDQMSEEFRKRAAGEFDETVREMRSKARELEQAQEQLSQQLEQIADDQQPGLRAGGDREAIQQSLREQSEALGELLEQVQRTVQEAEPAEPLLAQELYETYRKTQQNHLDRRLTDTQELLRRGLDPQAQQVQRQAAESTSELRRDLEKAAESVLGNEQKALERALNELDKLDQALQSELAEAKAGGQPASEAESQNGPRRPAADAAASTDAESGDPQSEDNRDPQPAGQRPGPDQDQESQSQGQNPQGQNPQGQNPQGQNPQGQNPQGQNPRGQNPQGQIPSGQNSGNRRDGGLLNQMEQGGGGGLASPIAGDGFRQWTDGLRDVEEMVGDPVLRSEAAAIRDRARQMRLEMRRHSEPPQWSLVESMIAKPLRELKAKVSEELLRRAADRADPVPIDRDPVPEEFSNAVKRYYESLGSGR
ncbi:MAG: hypothetical protein ACO1RT_02720 [Planctomycetaceae bacterium]